MNKLNFSGSSLFLYLLLSFGIATAQKVDVNLEELLNGQVSHVNNLLYFNLSFIQQIGNENKVITYQYNKGLLPNLVDVEQQNQGNSAYIEQDGSGHEITLLQQGIENMSRLLSDGENIKLVAKQTGDGNYMNTYIENNGPQTRSAELTQEGNFNKIDLSLKGDGFSDPTIEQRVVINQQGNFHELTVSRDPFSDPLEITQTAGTGGMGMKVEIITSEFTLPMK